MIQAVASNHVAFHEGVAPGTIIYSVENGKILDVLQGRVATERELIGCGWNLESYDIVSPYLIMPGLVDAHVHLNEPGRTEWEGFETGTKAAVAGGVTTVIDMPLNAIPPTTNIKNFKLKLDAAEGQLWCDVGFWGGLVPDNLADLKPLVEAGVRGFKGFLIDSGVDEFPAIDKRYIQQALHLLQGEKTMVMFHAELQLPEPGHEHTIVDYNGELGTDSNAENLLSATKSLSSVEPKYGQVSELIQHHEDHLDSITTPLEAAENEICDHSLSKIDPCEYNSFLLSRPDHFETDAVALIVSCLRNSILQNGIEKSPFVHIVHLASMEALPILKRAKDMGLPITAETCFHYLSLAAERVPKSKTFYKCCPPIRSEKNRKELWRALREGLITSVVSDHSPCIPELKDLAKGDFFSAWGGIASVGLGLPLLYTNGASIAEIIQWCCENTSKQVGLDHRKGFLRTGYDADFVIFDINTYQTVDNDKVYFKNKLTAYDGFKLKGLVRNTYVRGKLAFELDGMGHNKNPPGQTILERRRT
ncbi:allantoinase [Kluyveromyces lactis]|uniref:KLLA0C04301p n=1 Tax=Kluyveromyces lactis (strain ATCC 8585 / CBS 2359 / DSM 70799 / NBRC 1267 / NRRL Y-1140 / WM37) TaxID=284590 RepID=Q6CUK0_KLULA|nr:uncharacterized protein KLLA0_C04301g [Kluyveromyces lactis]CAH01240.1 KLLA0C04301p [Kluyveromyces lactis]|eukprot:XP_452389.1 uncharacterized protein KLLA0_C04301g [Kluyveromyces lactis]